MFGTRAVEHPLGTIIFSPFYASFESQKLVEGANLKESNLRYADARQATMIGVHLDSSDLRGARFNGANLTDADFHDANLQDADFRETKGLTAKQLIAARNWVLAYYSQGLLKTLKLPFNHNQRVAKGDFRNILLPVANLSGADLRDINLQGASLQRAVGLTPEQLKAARNWPFARYSRELQDSLGLPPNHLQRIAKKDFHGYDLRGANLRGADSDRVNLADANLQGANLREANGLTKDQLLQAGNWALANYSNAILRILGLPTDHNSRIEIRHDLGGYSLQGVNLKSADLEGFNLADADLQGAALHEARGLTKQQLQAARNWVLAFYSQDILNALGLPLDHNARISKKDLRGYMLRGANLKQADLEGFNLADADLQGAALHEARGLPKQQLRAARNWVLAFYSQDILNALGLPLDHNERVAKKDLRDTKLEKGTLYGARLQGFNLQGADLRESTGLTKQQLRAARNWVLAFYSQDILNALGLPLDHNERVAKRT